LMAGDKALGVSLADGQPHPHLGASVTAMAKDVGHYTAYHNYQDTLLGHQVRLESDLGAAPWEVACRDVVEGKELDQEAGARVFGEGWQKITVASLRQGDRVHVAQLDKKHAKNPALAQVLAVKTGGRTCIDYRIEGSTAVATVGRQADQPIDLVSRRYGALSQGELRLTAEGTTHIATREHTPQPGDRVWCVPPYDGSAVGGRVGTVTTLDCDIEYLSSSEGVRYTDTINIEFDEGKGFTSWKLYDQDHSPKEVKLVAYQRHDPIPLWVDGHDGREVFFSPQPSRPEHTDGAGLQVGQGASVDGVRLETNTSQASPTAQAAVDYAPTAAVSTAARDQDWRDDLARQEASTGFGLSR